MTLPASFGFVATAVEAPGTPDKQAYEALFGDCEYGQALGYDSVWLIEHHFSDYFPTPNPLALLSNLSARFPRLGLGTCVLVTPWHDPLRLAEDIAQLASITDAPLHLGMGRGTAKFEYDALGIQMDEAQDRFRDTWEIIRSGLAGGPFRVQGKLIDMPREVVLRPVLSEQRRRSIHFYGAIGSPGTAERMADMGLPPICTTIGDWDMQRDTIVSWKRAAAANGFDTGAARLPIMINCIIGDTDEEAIREAQTYIPRFMQAQVDHYEADANNWETLRTYKAWSGIFSKLKARCDPANIPDWCQWQLIGSPETVTRRLRQYRDIGFDTFLIHVATPGVPVEPRRRWLRRFAQEVMPALAAEALA
ncbi:LLM class flavin-dependent oxidoreductase [Rhizorhabdus wittichii]|uniref:LLM class flavin-dependent oxidoreductase n=1 Tax=Rhizorhabdus wittichii TaxID=160791 RepID=UPI00030F5767|nr:LLM class flavin-dependent oxidoreductase [Rhizorhabdus wittichii]